MLKHIATKYANTGNVWTFLSLAKKSRNGQRLKVLLSDQYYLTTLVLVVKSIVLRCNRHFIFNIIQNFVFSAHLPTEPCSARSPPCHPSICPFPVTSSPPTFTTYQGRQTGRDISPLARGGGGVIGLLSTLGFG